MIYYCCVDDAWNERELEQLGELCSALGPRPAQTFSGTGRMSETAFLQRDDANAWVFDRISGTVNRANEHFRFVLQSFASPQYAEYRADNAGHYDWHIDLELGRRGNIDRKLSMTLQLNEGYTGGEFQINLGDPDDPMTLELPMGRAIFFPSFLQHRVLPVISGVRKSLVVWVEGPTFT